jgi:hypothetical protein
MWSAYSKGGFLGEVVDHRRQISRALEDTVLALRAGAVLQDPEGRTSHQSLDGSSIELARTRVDTRSW